MDRFQEVRSRFLDRVCDLTSGLYPKEPQPQEKTGTPHNADLPTKRTRLGISFRPYCDMPIMRRQHPTVPELAAGFQGNRHQGGTGHLIRHMFIRDSHEGIRPVPRNRLPGQGHLPLPELRGDNTRRIHLSRSPGWQTGTPALLRHLPRHLGNNNKVRAGLQETQNLQRIPSTKRMR